MAHNRTFKASFVKLAGTLLAASFLAGCEAPPSPETYAAQAAPGQFNQSVELPAQAPQCDGAAAGELQLRMTRLQAFVPIKVNNTTLNLLLDTGDFVTALTPDTATRLALPAANQPSLTMTGIGGDYQAPIVQAADVQYLSSHVDNLPFAVLPAGEFRPDEGIDGLFGANFLSAFNVELDFPGHRMRFYKSNSECGAAAPAWTAHATRLRAANAGHDLLLIPVRINGVELNALIDTGSEDTSITKSAAEELGITSRDMRGDEQITETGLGESTERLHQFASIDIGGSSFKNPVLAVDDTPSPLQTNIMMASASALPVPHKGVDVILGANYLFKKRIFLDYRNEQVYIQ